MKNRELITNTVEQLIGQGNLEIIETAFSPKYVAHAENKKHEGQNFIKKFSKLLRKSIPDIKVLKVEIFSEVDNTITWQRTLQGTHKVNMMGIPASNKKISWNEMVVSRFEDNRIAEEWIVSELMGQLLLKQGV